MTQKQLSAFLDNTEALSELKSMTPEPVNEYIRYLERRNFALWDVFYQHHLGAEAEAYVKEHGDDPVPFEW